MIFMEGMHNPFVLVLYESRSLAQAGFDVVVMHVELCVFGAPKKGLALNNAQTICRHYETHCTDHLTRK